MKLAQILFSQGFGARRECEGLVATGHVRIGGEVHDDPFEDLKPEGLVFSVRGEPWAYHEKALLMMHKPAGVECSQKPKHHMSVYSLLPAPLRKRDVQSIGRLDEDTTGLLLFTDDGALIHRFTSPKKHVPKVYEVTCKHPVTPEQVQRLLEGVKLVDDHATVQAAAAEATGETTLRLTLTEGKYHQVKRMLAAVGNRVEGLHRSAFGKLVLPADLAPGQWRWLPGPEVI
ncbi:16S rRNA pseudouridine(516) synthase [Piscinibacter gummiphilus]|uniref:Pseudouridine synthase n=1 Tax=Piscinibacter gummiphilus TaxID=946333 RepID=A0ABZ0D3V7_9BURK|nr:16S rRNA pseudouridine(516) synthase [Piscinibacter gummiphilus]WOB09990.1 16S rRNA pseudouridine(516) synthase [Piscinibacter gummiphilus]